MWKCFKTSKKSIQYLQDVRSYKTLEQGCETRDTKRWQSYEMVAFSIRIKNITECLQDKHTGEVLQKMKCDNNYLYLRMQNLLLF